LISGTEVTSLQYLSGWGWQKMRGFSGGNGSVGIGKFGKLSFQKPGRIYGASIGTTRNPGMTSSYELTYSWVFGATDSESGWLRPLFQTLDLVNPMSPNL
jgi:hypothetical protein